jgi:cytochrome bd-type quinol oxidase subunit 1
MDTKDWLIVASTLLGPILAVQAQKWVEVFRERRGRKLWVVQQLMATRAARVSAEHVQALNMIDLVFYGVCVDGQNY